MNNRFKNIIDSANVNKEKFDVSMESLKGSLKQSVEAPNISFVASATPKTGWLRGSLSYPWVLICTIAPAIKEIF